MYLAVSNPKDPLSPSARKVWIEMKPFNGKVTVKASPSARKVWIEIEEDEKTAHTFFVTFRKEGVD